MNSSEYVDLLTPLQEKMIATDELRQQHRASPLKDHLALVADGLSTLAWVTTNMKPADYAAELFGGAQMYGNKVLKQYKDK
jgi:adenylyl cyclase-associated protein